MRKILPQGSALCFSPLPVLESRYLAAAGQQDGLFDQRQVLVVIQKFINLFISG